MNAQAKIATRAPMTSKTVDVVVVGAGFSGLYMTHRLREAGLSFQGFEAGADVGGTWYWNRYPGARCDIPSLLYSYSWSDELRAAWSWSEKYAPQPEILAYANHVADHFDLRGGFAFNTCVTSANYNDATQRWTVETDCGDQIEARFCIMATGCLSVPRKPDIAGSETFAGETYVTGLWPHEGVDFSGKRVAMIGTGSSSIQSLPLIAQQAASVTVFQRTPNFSLPAKNRPLTTEEVAEFEANFPVYRQMLADGSPGFPLPPEGYVPSEQELNQLAEGLWDGGALVSLTVIPNLMRDEYINGVAADYVRGKIREIVKDPEVAERLTPRGYPFGSKRACVDSGFYDTFNKDHVCLVDLRATPITEITAEGVRTSEGDYPVDVIIFATGFDAMTGALLKMNIRGKGGVGLREAWEHGPKTYLGLQVAGFPNLFTVTGPGSPSVLTNMMTSIEQHVDWINAAISHVLATNHVTIEATEAAQEAWVKHVNETADTTLFPQANSWYVGANVPGKPRVFMPYIGGDYKVRCDEIVAKGYEGFAISG